MSAEDASTSMSRRVFEVIAARQGTTVTQVSLLMARPDNLVRATVAHLRRRGLVAPSGFISTDGKRGFPAALWVATNGDPRFSVGLERDKKYVEDDAVAARFAKRMGDCRYEDTPRSAPIVAPRVYVAEPGSVTGCTAAMCVER